MNINHTESSLFLTLARKKLIINQKAVFACGTSHLSILTEIGLKSINEEILILEKIIKKIEEL